MIYTSYYANIKNIPSDYFLVAASGSISKQIEQSVDHWDIQLAPSKSIFFEYKNTHNEKLYVDRFYKERLNKFLWLEKLKIYKEKAKELNKKHLVLLCYEHPTKFCHRHILAESISFEFNIPVLEYHKSIKYIRNNYKCII